MRATRHAHGDGRGGAARRAGSARVARRTATGAEPRDALGLPRAPSPRAARRATRPRTGLTNARITNGETVSGDGRRAAAGDA